MTAVKVLDAFAVLAFLGDEPSADQVRNLLLRAEEGKVEFAMTVVDLGEVWYAIGALLTEACGCGRRVPPQKVHFRVLQRGAGVFQTISIEGADGGTFGL